MQDLRCCLQLRGEVLADVCCYTELKIDSLPQLAYGLTCVGMISSSTYTKGSGSLPFKNLRLTLQLPATLSMLTG